MTRIDRYEADDFDQRVSALARQPFTYVVQNDRLDELVELNQQHRPRVNW